jgi:phosphate butyryltransferase
MKYTTLSKLAVRVLEEKESRPKVVAVAAADDLHTLEAVLCAARDGIAVPLLTGDRAGIREKLTQLDQKPEDYEIIDAGSPEDAAFQAALAVKEGRANFLMKGLIPTGPMLKVFFREETGFRIGRPISHISLAQTPSYHKLLCISDSAINIRPTLEVKRAMIENAVSALRSMGFDRPKVAVLTSTELINPKMPETQDAQVLKDMNQQGLITDCLVEGPISFDLAVSKEAAEIKGLSSPVYGDADLLITPDIASGNILLKSLRYCAGASTAGIVVGGRAPLVLTSRAVAPMDKYWPIVLAAAAAK